MAMETDTPKAKGGEALVSFFTKLPEQFQVPEDSLVVPANLARYGLSEVINRLLNLDTPVPFDFLIDGEFLRTDIFGYLESHKISSEKVLKLEYILALSEPKDTQVDEVPDWISSLVAIGPLPTPMFAASCFDGTVRLYDAGAPKLTVRLSDAPVTALAALSGSDSTRLVAAGKDAKARCFRFGSDAGVPAASAVTACSTAEHRQALEAVALSENGELMASAGWDHDVVVWNAGEELFPPMGSGSGSTKRKAASAGEQTSAKYVLKGHTQVVSSLHFGPPARYPFTLLSGSWDCSVRAWDIAAASCVCNWTVARAVTSFSMSPETAQLATSHEDGHVSLWDVRASPHGSVKGALSLDSSTGLPLNSAQAPHRRMASQVAWCPLDANRLASVGHDGNLCVLDPRSPKMPLQRLRLGKEGPVPNKLLCVAWLGRDEVAIGGSDGKVVRVELAQPRAE